MSTKRAKYSAAYKSKLVLEVLKNENTLSEIASANNITPNVKCQMSNYHKLLKYKRFLK